MFREMFLTAMFREMFLTAGYDGNVILWDAVAHVDLWVVQINGKVIDRIDSK